MTIEQSILESKRLGQSLLTELLMEVDQAVHTGKAAHEVEHQLFRRVLELGHQVLG